MPKDIEEFREQFLALDPSQPESLASFFRLEFRPGPSSPSGSTLWPIWLGIEKTPEICGGDARIVRTRIPVWVLEQMRRLGLSAAEILRSYPTLRAEDVACAWAYAHDCEPEISQAIRENEEA